MSVWFERKISSFICKWLGMPPGISNIVFYGQSNKLLPPLRALTEEFKVGKARVFMTLRDSQDPMIRATAPDMRTGIKWDAKQEVEEMESRLRHNEIVGAVQKDRAGFRSRPVSFFSKASNKGNQEMVNNEIRDNKEQIKVTKEEERVIFKEAIPLNLTSCILKTNFHSITNEIEHSLQMVLPRRKLQHFLHRRIQQMFGIRVKLHNSYVTSAFYKHSISNNQFKPTSPTSR